MSLRHIAGTAALLIAAPLAAQTQTQNSQAPAIRTIPGLDNFSLPPSGQQAVPVLRPQAIPTPVARPAPRPAVTPRATPSPVRSPVPVQAATRAPAPATPLPRPKPSPTPTPAAAPAPHAAVAPPPVAAPLPLASAVPAAAPAPASRAAIPWLVPIGLALLVLAALAFFLLRRRPAHDREPFADEEVSHADTAPAAPPPAARATSPQPPAPPPARTAGPAEIAFELRPKRAGTNLTSAAVEYAVIVGNTGTAAARGIAIDMRLISASAHQDEELRAVFAAPIDRPVVAPFDLPPGASVELTGMAMLPRDALGVMTVEGRALFVPVLTLSAAYAHDSGPGRAAAAWAIGIDRGAGAKMAPFRLDGPPRMHAAVVALAYPVPEAG